VKVKKRSIPRENRKRKKRLTGKGGGFQGSTPGVKGKGKRLKKQKKVLGPISG